MKLKDKLSLLRFRKSQTNALTISRACERSVINKSGFTLISRACKGFTLIELLIVIAILGALAGIVLTTFPATQGKARDSQRLATIKQIQTSLETFANANGGRYPSYTTATGVVIASGNICNAARLNISPCPTDPKGGTGCPAGTASNCEYRFKSDGSGGGGTTATQYLVWASLERPAAVASPIFVVCSNGESGYIAASSLPGGASVTCPL